MSAKRFKTLSGYVTNVSPVKEGKNRHNWAEGHIQTGSNTEEKVLFFFEKPKLSSSIYENALVALSKKGAVSLSGLSEDKDGVYLTCRSTEMKDRKVSFDRKEMVSNTNIGDVAHSSSDDSIITGRVVKLGPITNMMKYDNASQQKVEKSYRTAVIGDATGAVLAMLWEEIAKSVHEQQCVSLTNMRSTTDGRGVSYFTTTFRSQIKNLLDTEIEFDEEIAESLIGVELTLFQQVQCSIDSVKVDLRIVCPRCKTRTSSTDPLVVCTNNSCGVTFRSKATSVRVEATVTEDGTDKEHHLVAYKDVIAPVVGNTDQKSISEFFMGNDDRFKLTFHCRSKVIETIEKLD